MGKLKQEQIEEIIRLRSGGKSVKKICDITGAGRNSVLRYIKYRDYDEVCAYQNGIRINDDDIKELHSQGLTNTEIGKALGCSRNSIGNHLKKLGLKANVSTINYDELIKLHSQGMGNTEIGEKLGYTRNYICFCLRKLGLESN